MKKTFTFLLVLFFTNSFSQLSISVDNRYGFKTPGSYAQINFVNSSSYYYGYGNTISTGGGATTFESKKYSFGGGYQGGINLRYGFKGGIGVDLGIGYLVGLKDKTTSKSENNNPPYSSSTYNGQDYYKAQMGRLNLGMSYIGEGKISPVIKMGAIFGMGNVVIHSQSTQMSTTTQYSYNPNPPYNTYTITNTTTHTYEGAGKFYGGVSLGFYSSMGINYKVNDNIALMLCLDVVVQDYSPKKYILTLSKDDGVDQLSKMKKSEKEVEFVKNYTDTGAAPNDIAPSQFNKISLPLSSFGPSFSIRYIIGKKKEAPVTTTEATPQQ